jgi:CheY-like chemotaxis protein
MELVDSYLKGNSLTALYDSVLIPVIVAAETDYRLETLDEEQRTLVLQSLWDILEDLGTRPPVASELPTDKALASLTPVPRPTWKVFCLPARAERDALAGAMLVQLLQQQGFEAEDAEETMAADELIALVEKARPDAVCVSVVTPSTIIHARYLCVKLRTLNPAPKIVVGIWGATENATEAARRLRESGADEVVTTLSDAVVQLAKLAIRGTPAATVFGIPSPPVRV